MQPPFINTQIARGKTPETSDPNVKKMIDEIRLEQGGISPNANPQIIEIQPGKDAKANDCFIAVKEKACKDGGSLVLGWELRYDGFHLRATFHAVWKDSVGNLLDITPKLDNRKHILFVDAPDAKYEEKQVPDILLNHTKNPLADDLAVCSKAIFNIENKGERAYQYGEITFTPDEVRLRVEIQKLKDFLEKMIMIGKTSKNVPCLCGGSQKYKYCCGQKLKLKQLLKRSEEPS